MKISFRSSVLMVSAALYFTACGPEAPKQNAQETAVAFSQAVETAQLKKAWDLLPPTYQSDIEALTSYFATEVDPKKYDRFIEILGKYEKAFSEKKEIFAELIYDHNKSKVGGPESKEDVLKGIESIAAILAAIQSSDLSSVERLKAMDYDKFWAGSASKLLNDLKTITESSTAKNLDGLKALFTKANFELLSEQGDVSKLNMTYKTKDGEEQSEELLMSSFEGKWVPFEMAQGWDKEMAQIKADIDQLVGKGSKESAGMVSMFLGMADYMANEMLKVESLEDAKRLYMNSPFGQQERLKQAQNNLEDKAEKKVEDVTLPKL